VAGVRASAAFHHPIGALALEHILHRHAGGGRRISLGLKMHDGGSFVLAKRDRVNADVHGQQVGAFREVGHDTLADSVLILDIFFAAREQESAQRGGGEKGPGHKMIIEPEGRTPRAIERRCLYDLRLSIWQGKHEGFQSRLLEMMIGGESFGETMPLHDHEGEAIREAPVLIRAAPVQADSSAGEIWLKKDHFDQAVRVSAPITLGRYTRVEASAKALSHSHKTASVVTILLLVRVSAECHARAREWY
jgi:hypothetical protein